MCTHASNNSHNTFLTDSPAKLIISNAIPAIASMMFMAFYQIVDGIMVGRRLGPEALASINLLYPIIALIVGLAVMIGTGGNTRLAVLLGAGKITQARQTLGLITLLGTILGILGGLGIYLFFPWIIRFLGASGNLAADAGDYLRSLSPFFTSMILLFILEQSVRNDGKPNLATIVMACAALLNIILDYLFLFIFDYGIVGAALATGISKSLGASFFIVYFIKKSLKNIPGLYFAYPKAVRETLKSISTNGSSEFFGSLAVGVTTWLFNYKLLLLAGSLGIAAFALVQFILMIASAIFMGIGAGIQPIISYNHGAKLNKRVWSIITQSIVASLIIAVALVIILQFSTIPLVSFFIKDHPEALRLTLEATEWIRWSIIFMPIGIIGSICFTSIEQAGPSILIALSRGLILTVIGLLVFSRLLGLTGIWLTPLFSEGGTAIITLVLINSWQIKYLRNQEDTFTCINYNNGS
ncbi:MAG: multidrug transporter MatE [Firmicutes bacterium HGW-Firmicutes-2]|jgi:Na+-driven multidrug efflux pump|nr:MAG: multidrug transporter MatE [Firmicutes bacterium HGW-Firmicutes-2]